MTLYTTIRDNPYYDGLSRLLSADYEERYQFPASGPAHNSGQFDVDLSYDLNGNIETLERNARGSATNFPLNPWETTYTSFTLDNLTYDYTGGGNQLQKVSDAATTNQTAAYAQFLDGSNSGDDYDYDANGNLTQDLNKGISSISYNHLNKPTVITYSNGNIIRYYYNAVGMKLRQTVYSADQADPPVFAIRKRSDYLGAIHYEDADGDGTTEDLEILFAQHEEGRYRPNGSDMIYEYTLTDHLGNTRITFGDSDADGDAEILQENHYYPFGLAMTMSTASSAAPSNEYLYNGKELQTELGLDWYDYGARMYDASIGRWNGVDALAEKYLRWSSYNYTLCNPIVFTDPDGMSVSVSTIAMNAWNATPEGGNAKFTANRTENENREEDKEKNDPTLADGDVFTAAASNIPDVSSSLDLEINENFDYSLLRHSNLGDHTPPYLDPVECQGPCQVEYTGQYSNGNRFTIIKYKDSHGRIHVKFDLVSAEIEALESYGTTNPLKVGIVGVIFNGLKGGLKGGLWSGTVIYYDRLEQQSDFYYQTDPDSPTAEVLERKVVHWEIVNGVFRKNSQP